jgi:tetratricopeptide (TPR) repeat protein
MSITVALLVLLAAPGVTGTPESIATALARGHTLYSAGKLPEALDAYRTALQIDSTSFETLCHIAQVESELGEDKRGAAAASFNRAAVGHARAAVRVAPDSAQGHAWLAVTLGREALAEGPRERLRKAREIKSEIDRALAIDPNIGRAYHARAIWNRTLASLNTFERLAANAILGGVPKGATMDQAVRDLEKAVALEPGYVNHHLELGRTFMMLHRNPEARRELEQAIALPPTSNSRDTKYQAEARELLAKL